MSVSSQPTRKKRKTIVVDVEEESDDDIQIIEKNRPSTQPGCANLISQDNLEGFYTQQQHPKFHTRNLERVLQKERAWSKPLPEVQDLFFVVSAPKKFDDLAVSPKTLNKLKASLLQGEDRGHILLVTGPAGSAKSTSIDIIAKSLRMDVLKWEHSANLEVVNYAGGSYLKEESEFDSLITFLRSSTLPIKTRGRNSEKPRRRLYHIDELPTMAYQDAGEFRRLIYPYLRQTKHIIVFDLTTRDSSWYMSPKRVLPGHFINSLSVCEVNFHPIASTYMRKGLRRAVDFLGFQSRLAAQDYRAIEKIANGDIRSAINIIQFALLSSHEKFSLPNVFEAASSDELFHMLGSLLYAKRQSETEYSDVELTVREDLRRPLPTREVNDTLLMSRASADTVMMFLHEHEPNFSGSVACTRKVLDAMSVSDAMSTMWETRQISQEYSSQICARATMYYNYKANRIARGFYAYHRPKWFSVSEKTTALKHEMNEVLRFFGSSDHHCADMCVPYLSMIKPSLASDQYRLVSYLTRPWGFSWSTDRDLWEQRLSADPAYRIALSRLFSDDFKFYRSFSKNSLSSSITERDDSDEELFVIEDSDEDVKSDDSFDEPVTVY
ncbi:Rad17 cell cycle checkpoint protein [Trichostrongylus colubriformis]|uniref:Rad17 cell cycle checkpoint protein n=1 Tax=Trichostrongylus colubriformis TaxID=6319 RepID=A0AAN8FPM5_TRICO